ncbi:MAG: uroporphyrinogen-III synthase [Roseinatronobacter sp.]
MPTHAPPCLILTRPEAASRAFAQDVRAAGWKGTCLIAPLQRIALMPPDPDSLSRAQALVFTSHHAVAALAQATTRRDWPVWAVGPRTAQAARLAGFADVTQGSGTAPALLSDLRLRAPQGPILHLCGRHLACDLARALRDAGHDAQSLVAYDQLATVPDDAVRARIAAGGALVCPVFSPRSARLLVAALEGLPLDGSNLHLVAISAAAADGAAGLQWHSTRIASTPDAEAMIAALLECQAVLEPAEKPS